MPGGGFAAAPVVGEREFAALMAPLAPFEPQPLLAIAVSGGADSMALALLAARWAHRRGGQAHALTVDHGLRREAHAEALQVGAWLRDRGLAHHCLRWRTPVSGSGVQAAARQARYRLLSAWCRRHGVLHLLTAHHLDDQAETVLMRLLRFSRLHGLAGMPAAAALDGVRLLRPLLTVPHARLQSTLRRRRQPWLEDPSNADPRFARVRARAALAALDVATDETEHAAADGIEGDAGHNGDGGTAAFVALARAAGTARAEADAQLASDAAAAVRLFPAGYALLDRDWWQVADAAARRHLLTSLLLTIGPRPYPARGNSLARLLSALEQADTGVRTLAGCRIAGWRGQLLVSREAGRLPQKTAIAPGQSGRWDRFDVGLGRRRQVAGRAGGGPALLVGALGQAGWRQVRDAVKAPPPAPVRATLPALWQGDQVLAVPQLGFCRPGNDLRFAWFSTIFAPSHPLVPVQHRVV